MSWSPQQQITDTIEASQLARAITAKRAAVTLGTFTGLAMQTSAVRPNYGAHVMVGASATIVATLQHGDTLEWSGAVAATSYTINRIDYDGYGTYRILLDDHAGAP